MHDVSAAAIVDVTPLSDESRQVCTRCIYDDRTPGISFDDAGVCNYCDFIDELSITYGTGKPEGEAKFAAIVEEIKRRGRDKKYDCVVGVSGGVDSSYMLYKAVEVGLRPLAVHYDNTWNSSISTENIRKITSQLNVDLYTHVVDNREMDDIYRSFFYAAVPAIDVPTDIALTEVLYRAASKHGIKYILEGHSFRAEGVSPVGYSYFDGKYVASIHRQFGTRPMRTFPNMSFASFLKWVLIKRIKKIRPLWYLNYSKEEARAMLEKRFGWKYYGGHHLENRMTAFSHSFHNPVKFGMDQRNNSLAASVRSGQTSREEALRIYSEPPHIDPELLEYTKKRLNFTDAQFDHVMNLPPKSFLDYPTYKKRFERLRILFLILAKANLVPMSFYHKYCLPLKQSR